MKDYQLNIQVAEHHPFSASKSDDFFCDTCHKPRALHVDSGFIPAPDLPLQSNVPLRSANIGANLIGKPLTDRQIDKYAEAGWYSAEFKEARRIKMNAKRKGNFIESDGRMIYSPTS